MARVRLRPSVEPFAASTGDLYLLRTDGEGDLVVRDADPAARALVEALADGGAEEGLAGIGQLAAAGLITHADDAASLSPAEAERYDRQLHYFADQATAERGAGEMQLALRDASVVVLGAGGLGTWTMAGLACAGVGRIVAVDHDRIELANLNRQILYGTSDLGRLKVEVAAEALLALNPALELVAVPERIASAADVLRAAADATFVVCTADQPVHRIGRWVNEACLELGVPHISAGQFPPRVRVGPTVVPGVTGCLGCQEAAIRRSFPLYDELVEQRRRSSPVAATLGPASGLIGSLIAMDVIHSITGITGPATLGRALVFDLRDFSTEWERVERDPDCELGCAGAWKLHAGGTIARVPDRLYFTESDEANALIAADPMALLVGFELDQRVTVMKAFQGPLALKERLGAIDAATLASADLEPVFFEKPVIHRYPRSMAKRVHELAVHVRDRYGGDAARVWADASDPEELRAR